MRPPSVAAAGPFGPVSQDLAEQGALAALRPELAAAELPVHGGRLEGRETLLDFSTNLNAFLPRLPLRRWLRQADWNRYPDPDCRELCQALGRYAGLPPECIWPGNGASELIFCLAWACLRPADRVVVVGPTFSEYARACRVAHAQVHELMPPPGGRPPLQWTAEALQEQLARLRPRMVWLCNPNNPTGQYLRRRELQPALDACDALWVVDESYLPFVEAADDWSDLALAGRVVLLRSLTKWFSVPGLRLGYVVAHPRVVHALRTAQPPWSVHAGAQHVGVELVRWAERHAPALQQARRRLARARQQLAGWLEALGMPPLPSQAPFLLARAGDGREAAEALRGFGVLVRDAGSFGLAEWIRVGVRRPGENRVLVEALARWKARAFRPWSEGVQR